MTDSSLAFSQETGKVKTKFLALIFLYLALGVFVTLGVGLLYSYILWSSFEAGSNEMAIAYIATFAISGIGIFVMMIINSVYISKTNKAPWVGFLIFAVLYGLLFSGVLLTGVITFYTLMEALGITTGLFLIMFLLGYFSKINWNPIAFIALTMLIGVLLVSMFFGIWYLISPSTFMLLDFIISIIFIIAVTLIVGVDANRAAKIAASGMANNNLALFMAYNFYVDFIGIFLRVLLLLASSRNN
jgi:FtsH-binding integral membrane protein